MTWQLLSSARSGHRHGQWTMKCFLASQHRLDKNRHFTWDRDVSAFATLRIPTSSVRLGFFLGLWIVQNAAAHVLTRSLKCECTILILQNIKTQHVTFTSDLDVNKKSEWKDQTGSTVWIITTVCQQRKSVQYINWGLITPSAGCFVYGNAKVT